MSDKVSSTEFFVTDLALYLYFWALAPNMLPELPSRQILVLRQVTDVTTEFGTLVILDVLLQFMYGHPYYF